MRQIDDRAIVRVVDSRLTEWEQQQADDRLDLRRRRWCHLRQVAAAGQGIWDRRNRDGRR